MRHLVRLASVLSNAVACALILVIIVSFLHGAAFADGGNGGE